MRKPIFALALVAFSLSAQANENIKYVCTKSGVEDRVIEVVYATPDAELPCDVAYTKDGATKNLWHYDNTQGACEARAAEFADKQRAWGMDCTANSAAATSAAAATTSSASTEPAAAATASPSAE